MDPRTDDDAERRRQSIELMTIALAYDPVTLADIRTLPWWRDTKANIDRLSQAMLAKWLLEALAGHARRSHGCEVNPLDTLQQLAAANAEAS